jgi:hypothetical protein
MTAHAETFPRAGLPRLTGIELRKMADTRAGFWLLLVIGLLAAAIVAITVIAGAAKGPELPRPLQRRDVGRLGRAARPRHPGRHE